MNLDTLYLAETSVEDTNTHEMLTYPPLEIPCSSHVEVVTKGCGWYK